MYVVVRQDLPGSHLIVQVSHAAMAATAAFWGPQPRTHPNLVLCVVPDEPSLLKLFNGLKEKGVPCCVWHEDDMGGSLTGVATAENAEVTGSNRICPAGDDAGR